MSRNLRAVKVEWGPCASLIVTPDAFEQIIQAVIDERIVYEYRWNDADEVFKLWVEQGELFLDLVRDCRTRAVLALLDKAMAHEALPCLKNLKALEPEWRRFIDRNGHLEIWVDGY